MEEYHHQTSQENQVSLKRKLFSESQLNQVTPLWMKLIFFVIGWLGFKVLAQLVQAAMLPLYRMGIIDAGLFNCLLMLIVYGLLALTFALFLFFNKKIGKAFLLDFKDYKAILSGLVVCVVVLFAENLMSSLYSTLCPDIYGANSNQQGLQSYVSSSPIMLFFPIVLFAPFTEELTYRVGLVDSAGNKNRWIGIIISAIIFGFIHFSFDSIFLCINYDQLLEAGSTSLIKSISETNIPTYYTYQEVKNMMLNEFLNLPIYILAGFIMAFGYAFTGKISTSITAHFTNNLISYISMLILLNQTNNSQMVTLWPKFLW